MAKKCYNEVGKSGEFWGKLVKVLDVAIGLNVLSLYLIFLSLEMASLAFVNM